MEKQLQKIETKIQKVSEWIERTIKWNFQNGELILDFLDRKMRILEKSKAKLIKLNKTSFIS